MSWAAIGCPDMEPADVERIQSCRKLHDQELFNVVGPHITFVFPVDGVGGDEFTEEIIRLSSGFGPISFILRQAIVEKHLFSDCYQVFLVPDEGYNAIISLHDALYAGRLNRHLRRELKYIPHITVATAPDESAGNKLADDWNRSDLKIKGRIARISTVELNRGSLRVAREIELLG